MTDAHTAKRSHPAERARRVTVLLSAGGVAVMTGWMATGTYATRPAGAVAPVTPTTATSTSLGNVRRTSTTTSTTIAAATPVTPSRRASTMSRGS